MEIKTHEVIIVGAGLSGLATAHFLRKARPDCDLVLLEGGDRPGGAIRSCHDHGFLAEWGPHGFLDNVAESRELLADTGLDREAQRAPLKKFLRYVCHHGCLVALPQNPRQLLSTPLLSTAGKLRLLGDLWKKPLADEPTVAQWAAHRFGREVLPLVDAAVTGTFAGDFERLSIDAVMPGVRDLEQRHGSILRGLRHKKREKGASGGEMPAMVSFPQGMERLVEVLATGLPVRTETPVRAVRREAGQWRVTTENEELRGAALVVALPVNPALALLRELSVPPVAGLAVARIANVLLGFPNQVEIPYGFGYLAPERERRFALGAMFSTHMFPGRAPAGRVLIEVLVGGRRHPGRIDLPDEEIVARVLDDLKGLLPLTSPPCFRRVLRPSAGIPQLEADHPALCRWRRTLEESLPGLHLCGFGWDGIGMNDMIKAAKRLATAVVQGRRGGDEAAPVKPVYF